MWERITHIPRDKVVYWQKRLVEKWFGEQFGQYEVQKADSIDGKVAAGWGESGNMASLTSASGWVQDCGYRCLCCCCWRRCVCVCSGGGGGGSLEGETWFSSLEITSTQQLLGRNIKIHPDISQVFYHALSDPIPSYHTLHTLKHGYPFLDTLLTFKCKRRGGKTRGYLLPKMEEFG